MGKFSRAAWVPNPDGDEYEWEDAIGLAVDWTSREAVRQQSAAVLVVNSLNSGYESWPQLRSFAARNAIATPQSTSRVGPGRGPVLAFVPDAAGVALAVRLVHDSSLCIFEGSLLPLAGWAAAAEAVDLTNVDAGPMTIDETLAKALDSLHFISKPAGWTGPYEKSAARSKLDDLRVAAPHVDADFICSYMLAKGSSWKAVKGLRAMIDSRTR